MYCTELMTLILLYPNRRADYQFKKLKLLHVKITPFNITLYIDVVSTPNLPKGSLTFRFKKITLFSPPPRMCNTTVL